MSTISYISQLYWKNIKEGSKTFASITTDSRRADIITLAKADVVKGKENGGITEAEYKTYIGEKYTA